MLTGSSGQVCCRTMLAAARQGNDCSTLTQAEARGTRSLAEPVEAMVRAEFDSRIHRHRRRCGARGDTAKSWLLLTRPADGRCGHVADIARSCSGVIRRLRQLLNRASASADRPGSPPRRADRLLAALAAASVLPSKGTISHRVRNL